MSERGQDIEGNIHTYIHREDEGGCLVFSKCEQGRYKEGGIEGKTVCMFV